jgi:hypothetical protein
MKTFLKAAVRILALFVFINLITVTASAMVVFTATGIGHRVLAVLIIAGMFVFQTAVLVIIWFKADSFVKLMTGESDDKEVVISASGPDFTTLMLRAFGLYFILRAIPQIAGLAIYRVMLVGQPSYYYYQNAVNVSDAQQWTVQIVTLIIGISLIVGAGRVNKAGAAFGNFWKYGSMSGTEPKSPTEEEKPS